MTLFVVGGPMVLFVTFALSVIKLHLASAKQTHDLIVAILARSEHQEERHQERMRVIFESLMAALHDRAGKA